MPERSCCEVAPRKSGGVGEVRSLLVLGVLLVMVLFGCRYVHAAVPAVAAVSGSMGSQGSFGWLGFLATPLYLALRFLHGHGVENWGGTLSC